MAESADKVSEIENTIEQFSQLIRSAIRKTSPQIDQSDMDDIEQEVKIKIWRKVLKSEKEIHNFGSYIWKVTYTTTSRTMKNLFIQRKHLLGGVESGKSIEEVPQVDMNDPDQQFETRELMEIIRESVNSLIDSRRQVLKLYLMGMSLNEIADFLCWSEAKTRNLLSRGLADIRQKLQEIGLRYSPSE